MFHFSVQNDAGDLIELTNNANYDVLQITGLNPTTAAINTVAITGMDGTRFNSSRVEQRNIVITLNIRQPIEANRLTLYRFFRPKNSVRLFYHSSRRNCYIDGYVESFENSPFTKLQQPQISIICPQPFWKSNTDTVVYFTDSIPNFDFPFSITSEGQEFSTLEQLTSEIINAGEIETGGVIVFRALADGVENPTFYNRTTQKYIGVTISMQAGDIISIDTRRGSKSIMLQRSGTTTNLLSLRSVGSSWVEFKPGDNEVSFDADAGTEYMRCSLTVTALFEGV